VVLAVLLFGGLRARERKLEERRSEAHELRRGADEQAETAKQREAEAQEQADKARREREAAEARAQRADELDPDVDT
jgi:hypothetical protein